MSTFETNCGKSNNFIREHIKVIKCDTCEQFFHVKCCEINHRTYNSIKQSNNDWHCIKCASNVSNTDKLSVVDTVRVEASVSSRKKTTKQMATHLRVINCNTCKKVFSCKMFGYK